MLFDSLATMGSFNAIANLLDGIILDPLQQIDVMKMLARKRGIISYDTGLGKTVLTAAVIKCLQMEHASRRFIIFCKKDQFLQTPAKLKSLLGKDVIFTDGEQKNLEKFFCSDLLSYSIVLASHSCLQSQLFLRELFKIKQYYSGIIIDEAHELCNNNSANSATMLARLSPNFEYCWALTATPIITSVAQFAKLANLVDGDTYANASRLMRNLKRGNSVLDLDPCFFINRSRKDFGSASNYRGIPHWVEPMSHQIDCKGNNLFRVMKGEGAINQAVELVEIIKERKGQQGLIYINQHSIRQWILPFLDKASIRYACINGNTKSAEREEVVQAFNVKKTLDVIITSVTEALDLDCEYVVFYEFTVKVKQMIGRAHRGLGNKDLDIIFVITKGTEEEDYFIENIYERSILVKSILGKDCSELEHVAHYLIGE